MAGSLLWGLTAAGATSAGAATQQQATYSADVQIPAPPASSFAGSAGGDGWALAFTPSAVYNVFHHQQTLQVACHNQSDATACWDPKTITDTANGDNFAVPGQPGLWMDQATGHLFVFASEYSGSASSGTAATAGVVCIDTTQPASVANPFCGFTPLSGAGASPLTSDRLSGASDPVIVNHSWYAFDHVSGAGAGSGANQLMCFDFSTLAACTSQPYTVDIGLGASGTSQTYDWPEPAIAAIGNEVVVASTTSANPSGVLGCLNVATHGSCGAGFPITLTNGYPSNGGAPFPLLNSAGQVTGFCLPDGTDECYSLTGASVATPSGMTTVVPGNSGWDGPAITIGPRVYIADGNANQVECYDYSKNASCANFPHPLANQGLTYTVNSDPQRPSCIWTNADNGSGQIQNFDAYTGGACGSGSLRVISSAIVVPLVQCQPANFTSLTVVTPAPSVYGGGTVQFQDNDGVPIAGIPPQALDQNGSVNLAPFKLTTKAALPQFVITLNSPPANLSSVTVKLVWTGVNDASCAASGITVTVPRSNGMMLLGGDGGMFAYGASPFVGSLAGRSATPFTGLASVSHRQGYLATTSDGHIFTVGTAVGHGDLSAYRLAGKIVGIAATPTGNGYWMVGQDGGVFALGGAGFYGSMGGVRLAAPIVGIAPTATGHGYLLVASDGGVFAFGDAGFYGSTGGVKLAAPIVGMAMTSTGKGYLLAAADGGVFRFGDAVYHGSVAGVRLAAPVAGMVLDQDGGGYWLVGADGGVFCFGDAPYLIGLAKVQGSLPYLGPLLRAPIVAAAG